MAFEGRWPITVDPGPHAAVFVNWREVTFTFIRGGKEGEKRPPEERPKIKLPPQPGPPIRALRVDEAVVDSLRREDEDLQWEDFEAIDLGEGNLHGVFEEGEGAIPERNPVTVVFRIEGTNLVDLNQLEPNLREAAAQGAAVLIQFV